MRRWAFFNIYIISYHLECALTVHSVSCRDNRPALMTCDPGRSTLFRPLVINKDTGIARSSDIIDCHMCGSVLGRFVLNRPVVGCCCMFSCIERVYRKSSTKNENSVIIYLCCSRPAKKKKKKKEVLTNVNAKVNEKKKPHLCSHIQIWHIRCVIYEPVHMWSRVFTDRIAI